MPSDTPDWLPDTSASVDQLIALTTYTIAHSPSDFFDITAALTKSYQSFYLNFFLPSNPGAYTVGVTAFDPAGNAYWTDSYSWSFSGSAFFAVDVPGTVGGSVRFRVVGTPLGATVQNALYASVSPLPGGASKWRRDGRMRPIGSLSALGTTIAGGTLIVAPGAGNRILLKTLASLVQSPGAGNAILNVNVTIGGVTTALLPNGIGTASVATSNIPLPDDGLILDDNTAVTYSQLGSPTSVFVSAVYDLTK